MEQINDKTFQFTEEEFNRLDDIGIFDYMKKEGIEFKVEEIKSNPDFQYHKTIELDKEATSQFIDKLYEELSINKKQNKIKFNYEFENNYEAQLFYEIVENLGDACWELELALKQNDIFYFSQVATQVITDLFYYFSIEDLDTLRTIILKMNNKLEKEIYI